MLGRKLIKDEREKEEFLNLYIILKSNYYMQKGLDKTAALRKAERDYEEDMLIDQ